MKKESLSDKIKDLKDQAAIYEKILKTYPDAQIENFYTEFFAKQHLNFSTAGRLHASSILIHADPKAAIVYLSAFHKIDKAQFSLNKDISNKYEEIRVLSQVYTVAHRDNNQGFIIDRPDYLDKKWKFKTKENKQVNIDFIDQALVTWMIANTGASSFDEMKPFIRFVPVKLVNRLKNHFIM